MLCLQEKGGRAMAKMTETEKIEEVVKAMKNDNNIDKDTIYTVLLGAIANSLAVIADCMTKEEHS